MKIVLEQVFYGRGERGYGILGSSPGGRAFASRVQSLCGAVGTPNADYGGEPFLISAPESDSVIMICGRRGTPDSMGRATLFFHALIAEKSALSNAGVDAISLLSQNAFVGKMPTGDFSALCVDVEQELSRSSATDTVNAVSLPCVIRSKKPLPDVVRNALGERTLALSWATFAFQANSDFAVQVLPPRVLCPKSMNEYDAFGALLRPAVAITGKAEISYHPDELGENVTQKESGVMLKLSLFINIVLAVLCVVLLASRNSTPNSQLKEGMPVVVTNIIEKVKYVDKPIPAQLTDSQIVEIKRAALDELKERFPADRIVGDFDARYKTLPNYNMIYKVIAEDPKRETEKCFFEALKEYVDFVNKEILKEQTP